MGESKIERKFPPEVVEDDVVSSIVCGSGEKEEREERGREGRGFQ